MIRGNLSLPKESPLAGNPLEDSLLVKKGSLLSWMDNRSMISKSKKSSAKGGKSKGGMNAEQDLEDFVVDDMILPIERKAGGIWVQKGDFDVCFQYLQIYHDPKKYDFDDSFDVA